MAKQRPADHSVPEPTADALAFRAAVRDVKPLTQATSPQAPVKPKPRARLRPAAPQIDEEPPPGELIAGADPLAFQRAGVRTMVMRRLRRGLYPIEDELDLHGLTQTAARDRLAGFVAFNRDAGRRCVRIIHGKGYRSGARGPVLKSAVNQWLRHNLDVMAFTSARTLDGGTGAVYVLLRA